MPTGSEAFLELPGVCGLRPSAWTHLKKALCHNCPVGGTEDKYRLNAALLLRRSILYRSTKNKMATRIPTMYKHELALDRQQGLIRHETKSKQTQSPISQTIQVIRVRLDGSYGRCKDELLIDFLQWTIIHGLTRVRLLAKSFFSWADTGWSLGGLLRVIIDRDGWRDSEIAKGTLFSSRLRDDDNNDNKYGSI